MESKEGEVEVKDALESSFNSEVAVKPKKVTFLSGLRFLIIMKSSQDGDDLFSFAHIFTFFQSKPGLLFPVWQRKKEFLNYLIWFNSLFVKLLTQFRLTYLTGQVLL